MGDAESRRLRESVMRGVVDYPTQWYGSRRLPVSPLRRVGDSPYHRYGESATPPIGDSGELFFEYKYLHEFEAKIGTARKVV
jgi:hypothetical protein